MRILNIVIMLILVLVVMPMIPLFASGDWNWWEAWAYVISSQLVFIVSRALAVRKNPDILKERAESLGKKDRKSWDKLMVPLMGLLPMLIGVVAGFDRRFSWTPALPLWVSAIGLVLLIGGYAFSSWALIANRFFSGVVRIQSDRGHHVVNAGPYRLLRHPGYAGGLMSWVGMPLLLGSWWGFIPAAASIVAAVIRTALEDRTLQAELPGYEEFTRSTRYRLFPLIW